MIRRTVTWEEFRDGEWHEITEAIHEHDWAEDTCIGDPDRLYVCLTCGATRTETRPGT